MAYFPDIEHLENHISQIQLSHNNKFKAYKAIIEFCRATLLKMRAKVVSQGFKHLDDEIAFFKTEKAHVLSELIFHTELYGIALEMPKADLKAQKRFLLKHINRMNQFLVVHIDFVQYMDLESDHLDTVFFTRKPEALFPVSLRSDYELDPEFNTSHDRLLAKFHAIRKLLPHLQQQLALLHGNSDVQGNSHLRWTSTKAALTELIYALHYARVINNGKADIQEIARMLQQLFHFELGDFYKAYSDIKARKKSRTKFLDDLAMGLITQLDKEDR